MRRLKSFTLIFLAAAGCASLPRDQLVVVNQPGRLLQLVDPRNAAPVLTARLSINPHEVAVSNDGRFAYSPIYGSGGVGRPGSDGDSIEVVDLRTGAVDSIPLGRRVRPHDIKVGRDSLLYVTAEVIEAVLVVDPVAKRVLAEIPTGRPQSHNIALSPDGRRAYTSNVSTGTVSVIDLRARRLMGVIAVDERVQRVSVSPDGRRVFTHVQNKPFIAVIDPSEMRVVDRYPLPQPGYASAVTPNGRMLIVAGVSSDRSDPMGGGELYLVDLASRSVQTVPLPGRPRVVAVSSDGRVAWTDLGNTGRVVAVDLTTRAIRHLVQLDSGLDGMALRADHRR